MRRFRLLKSLPQMLITMVILTGCNGGDESNKDLDDLRAFKSDSPYRDVIQGCVEAETTARSCTLTTLPTLGMDYNDPGIPQIMERVAVSHAWMGERFEELLHELPQEMLPLFRGVTAIVIDADIRPAYYTALTGAIYLDPAFLWLSLEEKASVSKKQDYRAGFDDPLAFRALGRYVKDGAPAFEFGSLTDGSTRELQDIVLLCASLLLHELAHANDFIPHDAHDALNPNAKVVDAIGDIADHWVSSQLALTDPLLSDTMFSLAGVMFRGNTPSSYDLDITAIEVGEAFSPDGAGHTYAYTSQFEDMAMLFESAMMKYFFDVDYEMAFTDAPGFPESAYCDSYIIGWGVRNRVGDNNVRARAEMSAVQLLPLSDFSAFFDAMEAPTEISGDWCLEITEFGQQKPRNYHMEMSDIIRPYL